MCDCREAVNERLAFSNAKIGEGLLFSDSRVDLSPPMIVLEKIDKAQRGKLPNLLATCCPFCGERYENGTTVIGN
jgi:hypothetical protein